MWKCVNKNDCPVTRQAKKEYASGWFTSICLSLRAVNKKAMKISLRQILFQFLSSVDFIFIVVN